MRRPRTVRATGSGRLAAARARGATTAWVVALAGLLAAALPGGGRGAALQAEPPAPAVPQEPWARLRADAPDERLAAVAALPAGLTEEGAAAIPFLVLALEDEEPSVRAAAAERLLAWAQGGADPLLDALEAARPEPRSGAFGALLALGQRVTATDIAFGAGGGRSPVQDVDRREVALVLALPKVTWLGESEGGPAWGLLRLGEALLRDPSPLVRRTAAGTLALLGGRAAWAQRSAPRPGAPGQAPRRLVRVDEPLRTRLVNLVRAGTDARTWAACELAGRFGDGPESLRSALRQALRHKDVRDAAALALADVGATDPESLAALEQAGGYGAWRALVRAGRDAAVLAALAGKDVQARRLAIAVLMAEERHLDEAAHAVLPDVEAALDDGQPSDVRAALERLRPFGPAARAALPLLEAFAAREDAPAAGRDLAAAFALRLDPGLAWAQGRLARWLLPPSPVPPPAPDGVDVASLLAAALDAERVEAQAPPAALGLLRQGPVELALWGQPLGVHAARWLQRHPAPEGPWVAFVSGLLHETSSEPRRSSLAPPSLRAYVELGVAADAPFLVRRAALDALALARPPSADTSAALEALLGAPDLWLRHLAARALRRLRTP